MPAEFQLIGVLMCISWLMGAVFDFYNTITKASKWLRWLQPTLDISFWVAASGLTFYVLFMIDDGRLRLYTFPLLILGYFLYRLILHRQVVGSALFFEKLIVTLFRFCYMVVRAVVIRPLLFIWTILRYLLIELYRLLCACENGLFWVLKFWSRLAMWPVFRRSQTAMKLGRRFQKYREDIWKHMSNWLKEGF